MFCASYCSSCTLRSFFYSENEQIGYTEDFTLIAVVPSPGARVTAAESLIRDLGRVRELWYLWGMKLNSSKTMIVSRSLTKHPKSPPITIGGTVLRESDDLLYWERHLIPRWPLRRIFYQSPEQLLKDFVSWRSPGECSTIFRFLRDAFGVFVLPVLEYFVLCCRCTPWTTGPCSQWCHFLTGGVFECVITHRRSVAVLCMVYKISCNPMHLLNGALPGLYVPVRVTCGLWSHIGMVMRRLAAEVRSITGLLFPSQCPSGTILGPCI